MNQPQCGPNIPPEVIEALKAALFGRAAAMAPAMLDPVEFGKDMAQQALIEAWGWLMKGTNQTEEDLQRSAYRILRWRLDDEYRKTESRQATQSIQALEEDAGVDLLLALTADEPLPDELAHRADVVRLVSRALTKLNDPVHRTILELRHLRYMNVAQIAQALDISERTVQRLYPKAVKAFKSALRFLSNDMNY